MDLEKSLREIEEKLSVLNIKESKHEKCNSDVNDSAKSKTNEEDHDRKRKRQRIPSKKVHEKLERMDIDGPVTNAANIDKKEERKLPKCANKQCIKETPRKIIVATRMKMDIATNGLNDRSKINSKEETKKRSTIKLKNVEDTEMQPEEVENILNLLKEMEMKKKANILKNEKVSKVTKKTRIEPHM